MLARTLTLITLLSGCLSAVDVVPGCEKALLLSAPPERVAASARESVNGWDAGSEVQIIAHRGFACCFPENTLLAIQGAFDMGADGVEIDVRFTRDGVPMLMHDETLDRTTNGSGLLSDYRYSQIRELDACSWFGREFPNCKVPTLRQALEVGNGRGKILLDLKRNGPCRIQKVLAAIQDLDMHGQVSIISASVAVLRTVRSYDREIPVGFVVFDDPEMDRIVRMGKSAIFFTLNKMRANPRYVSAARRKGAAVGGWTAHTPEEASGFLEFKLDWLLSDFPLYASN